MDSSNEIAESLRKEMQTLEYIVVNISDDKLNEGVMKNPELIKHGWNGSSRYAMVKFSVSTVRIENSEKLTAIRANLLRVSIYAICLSTVIAFEVVLNKVFSCLIPKLGTKQVKLGTLGDFSNNPILSGFKINRETLLIKQKWKVERTNWVIVPAQRKEEKKGQGRILFSMKEKIILEVM